LAPAPTTADPPPERTRLSFETSTISRPLPEDQPPYEWPPLRIATRMLWARAYARVVRMSSGCATYATAAGFSESKRVL
jgi:hypothetical protein